MCRVCPSILHLNGRGGALPGASVAAGRMLGLTVQCRQLLSVGRFACLQGPGMFDSETVTHFCMYALVCWCVSIWCAGSVGGRKHCRIEGALLGLVFGPLGVILASYLDGRPLCANC